MRASLLDKIAEFEDYSVLHRQGIPIEDIREAIRMTVSPYVRDQDQLKDERIYLLAGEAINIRRVSSEPGGESFLSAITEVYTTAMTVDPNACAALVAAFDPHVEAGKQKYVSIALLEANKAGMDTETLAHEVMRSIGATIEGPMRAFLDELLCLLHISDPSFTVNHSRSMTLGQVVEALQKTTLYQTFLSPMSYGVTLSQWRNIAQHLSFSVTNRVVTATYGTTNKKTVMLSHDDLLPLTWQIIIRLGALKAARGLYCWENIDKVGPLLPTMGESSDAILIDLSAMFLTQGFRISNLESASDHLKIVLEDLRANIEDPNIRAIHSSQFLLAMARRVREKDLSVVYVDNHRGRRCTFSLSANDAKAVRESNDQLRELAGRFTFKKETQRHASTVFRTRGGFGNR